jgi:hypothetical protein
MKIIGVEGLTNLTVQEEVQRGARFVVYLYCVSAVLVTTKRSSSIHYIRPGEGSIMRGLGWSGLTLLLGWWGIPWGPIYTIQSLWVNFSGGRDVTPEVLAAIRRAQGGIPEGWIQQPASGAPRAGN